MKKVNYLNYVGIFFLFLMHIVYQMPIKPIIKVIVCVFSTIMVGVCFTISGYYDIKDIRDNNLPKQRKVVLLLVVLLIIIFSVFFALKKNL